MYVHNINPTLLSIGPLEIRYYSLFYLVGIALMYYYVLYVIKQKNIKLTKDEVMDLLVYCVVGMLIGARVIYFTFYSNALLTDPLELFRLWNGGMSFHGGFIGIVSAMLIFCKKKKISFYTLSDMMVIPGAIALSLGRIGNFINAELYGRITTLPWGMDFGDGLSRHPSQLYESAKNLVIFGVLWTLKDKKLGQGVLTWTFIMLYGLFRFFIEFVREPDSQLGFIIGPFTMGQLLTAPMFLLGLFMVYRLSQKK